MRGITISLRAAAVFATTPINLIIKGILQRRTMVMSMLMLMLSFSFFQTFNIISSVIDLSTNTTNNKPLKPFFNLIGYFFLFL